MQHPPALSSSKTYSGLLAKGSIRSINMNDENYSTTIYNRVQTERVYEDSDPAENGGPLYDDVHEDAKREDN